MSSYMANYMTMLVREQLAEGLAVLQALDKDSALQESLVAAADLTVAALKSGHKLLVAGNGGSAADSQHLVAEFVSRLSEDRPALRAVALTTDSSILTALGNDYGFERIFARQIEALGQPGDVFLAISTSGKSPNILRALELARSMGLVTVGLTGRSGGTMAPLCDFCLRVPSEITMHIQQAHLALEHIFAMLVERGYFGLERFSAPAAVSARQG